MTGPFQGGSRFHGGYHWWSPWSSRTLKDTALPLPALPPSPLPHPSQVSLAQRHGLASHNLPVTVEALTYGGPCLAKPFESVRTLGPLLGVFPNSPREAEVSVFVGVNKKAISSSHDCMHHAHGGVGLGDVQLLSSFPASASGQWS